MQISVQIYLCPFFIHPGNELFDLFRGKQTKKEILPYPICSVVAVLKMLIRILDTLRSRIWDMVLFFFLCFGFGRNESNSLWEGDEGEIRRLLLARKMYRQKIIFSLLTSSKEKGHCHFPKNWRSPL